MAKGATSVERGKSDRQAGRLELFSFLQAMASVSAAHSARKGLIVAWATAAVNALIVAVALLVPYYQRQVERSEATRKAYAEKQLLIEEIDALASNVSSLASRITLTTEYERDPARLRPIIAEQAEACNRLRGQFGWIDNRFSLDPDNFRAADHARGALEMFCSALTDGSKRPDPAEDLKSEFSAWKSSLIRGYAEVAIIAALNTQGETGGGDEVLRPIAKPGPMITSFCMDEEAPCKPIMERINRTMETPPVTPPGVARARLEHALGAQLPR